jgi:calcineurin-like phosphoesterase family protein
MVDLWFYSDPHFGHENIITYCDRPFSDEVIMSEELVARHNQCVKPHHHVYCLGDFAMSAKMVELYAPRLQGHMRLIRGNHDIFKTRLYAKYFEEILSMRVIDGIIFTHIPIHPASMGRYRACVHGHIHNHPGTDYKPVIRELRNYDGESAKKIPDKVAPYINISVEVTDYRPLHFDEILMRVKEAKERCQ